MTLALEVLAIASWCAVGVTLGARFDAAVRAADRDTDRLFLAAWALSWPLIVVVMCWIVGPRATWRGFRYRRWEN